MEGTLALGKGPGLAAVVCLCYTAVPPRENEVFPHASEFRGRDKPESAPPAVAHSPRGSHGYLPSIAGNQESPS